jgi:hypothetical protein
VTIHVVLFGFITDLKLVWQCIQYGGLCQAFDSERGFFMVYAEHGGFRNNASIISIRASQAVLSARIFLTSKFIYLLFSNYNWDCKYVGDY